MKWGNKTSLNVTKNFFMLIPEESPLKDRHFNTCTVVGNSGILLNSSCGQEIDSMDFVIRCNLPQIEGYEKDVGSKANLTTMNPSVIGQHFGQWENKTADDYDRLIRRLEQIGDQILAWTKAGFKMSALRPSTGVTMYTLAATICDQIHMYGYYPHSKDTRGRAISYHYYDKVSGDKFAHNFLEEFRAFQELHRRGALVLHTEPCR
ncbi:CMP-N-acetylneuraminate-poly-alpha-2,8-sialyltransferase-like [Branchiostoma floridae x Branchiostoma japonicum]